MVSLRQTIPQIGDPHRHVFVAGDLARVDLVVLECAAQVPEIHIAEDREISPCEDSKLVVRERVGIEFAHAGLPSVASDTDGSVDAARNFILADFSPLGFFWFQSPDLGVGGDWILRARIEPETGTSGGGGVAAVPAVPFWGVAALAPALATCGAAGLRRPRRRRRPDGASARDRSDHSVPRMLRNQPWSS
jgi:hypothetical protein